MFLYKAFSSLNSLGSYHKVNLVSTNIYKSVFSLLLWIFRLFFIFFLCKATLLFWMKGTSRWCYPNSFEFYDTNLTIKLSESQSKCKTSFYSFVLFILAILPTSLSLFQEFFAYSRDSESLPFVPPLMFSITQIGWSFEISLVLIKNHKKIRITQLYGLKTQLKLRFRDHQIAMSSTISCFTIIRRLSRLISSLSYRWSSVFCLHACLRFAAAWIMIRMNVSDV